MGGGSGEWLRVPVGPGAGRWATRGRTRVVLLVVHNVTSATRLLDVVPLLRDEHRVRMVATCTGSSPFRAGVDALLTGLGLPVAPWEQAVETPVDLAISASYGGELHRVRGALVVLSHGVGYNKRLATGTPDELPDAAPVFGMAPEWLLAPDGSPVADVMVLSHPEQLARLERSCARAAPNAVLAGDPCFDRMLAARGYRERYRRALGVRDGQRLVVLNSTWNPESLMGDGGAEDVLPYLLARLTSELPVDEYRLAAVLHPNIWNGHGPGQVRVWFDRARRAGLTLVDPLEGWRQAVIAADAVIGDFGSVSYYAAALGVPVLLGAASERGLDPESPVAAFVRQAPRLDLAAPPAGQLAELLRTHRPLAGPARFTTSSPGGSAAALRRVFYGLMGLEEPPQAALLDPLPLPLYEPPLRTAPLRVVTRDGAAAGEVVVSRFAGPGGEPDGAGGLAHTSVHEDTLDPSCLSLADVIHRYGAADDPRFGSPQEWTAETLARYPQCALAAYVTGPGECVVRTRAGDLLGLSADARAADPAVYASAVHAWTTGGRPVARLVADGLTVRTGSTVHRVTVRPVR